MNLQPLRLLAITSDILEKTFFAIYIWDNSHDLRIILLFTLAYFAITPFIGLISGYLTDQFDIKITMLIGIWIQIIQIVLMINLHAPLNVGTLILIAILGGIGESFRSIPIHAIEYEIQSEDVDLNRYYADKSFVSRIINLTLPLIAAYLLTITGGNFDFIFQAIIILLIIKTCFVFFHKIPANHNTFDLKNILTFPGTNKDKGSLVKAYFVEGLAEGISLTIFPVILLIFTESFLQWGLINSGIAVFGVALSLFFTQWVNNINSKVLFAIGAFIFAAASTFFLAEINFIVILGFLLANQLMDVVKDIVYSASTERIMSEDSREYHLYSEYQYLADAVTSLGRIIPVCILLFTGLNINNDFTLRITLMIVGILPLITLSFLGRSKIFANENDVTQDIRNVILESPKRTRIERETPSLTS